MAIQEVTRKITISLPEELVEFADARARAWNTSRSRVIGLALSAVKTKEEEILAADGYRFYAGEASEFADAVLAAVTETWTDEWSPTQDGGAANGGQAG